MRVSPVLVLVDDEEGVYLLDLVAEDVHHFVNELGVLGVLEARGVHHGHVGSGSEKPVFGSRINLIEGILDFGEKNGFFWMMFNWLKFYSLLYKVVP